MKMSRIIIYIRFLSIILQSLFIFLWCTFGLMIYIFFISFTWPTEISSFRDVFTIICNITILSLVYVGILYLLITALKKILEHFRNTQVANINTIIPIITQLIIIFSFLYFGNFFHTR